MKNGVSSCKVFHLFSNKGGVQNQVAEALNRRLSLLYTMQVTVLGFEILKDLYKDDPYFSKTWEESSRSPNNHFLLQEGYLFKGNRLCIPQFFLREAIIIEPHGGELVGHFRKNKTLDFVKENFYWPKMERDVIHRTLSIIELVHFQEPWSKHRIIYNTSSS